MQETSTDSSRPAHNIELELFRLRSLVEAFEQLNTSLDLEQVLHNTLLSATMLMKAEVGSIALINDKRTQLEFVESTDVNFAKLKKFTVPMGEGIAGDVAVHGKSVRVEDVHQDERFYGKIDEKLGQKTQSYLCVPLIAEGKIIGTAQIMNRIDGKSFTAEDEELMEGFARQAALAIQNAKLHALQLKQKALDSELQICAQIQQKLYPERPPTIAGFEIFGSSVPCREVGGDYYSYLPRHDGSLDIVIADVSGKGLSASLMVSEVHSGLHLLSQMDHSLARGVQILNEHLVDSLIVGKFVTMFLARVYPGRNAIEYVLAGHPSPVIVNQKTGQVRSLERTGLIVGLDKKSHFSSREATLESGDLLISFSDGYSEAQNPAEELFEEERIGGIALEAAHLELDKVREILDTSVNDFTEGAPLPDDMTLLMLRKL